MAGKKTSAKQNKPVVIRSWAPEKPMGLARALQKAGYGSRDKTTDLVQNGRVMVDEKLITDPARTVDSESVLQLDGRPLQAVVPAYFAFNKPSRVVCTPADGSDRRQVLDFLPPDIPGLATVGRMDTRTTGLILVSNDAAWNNAVAGSGSLEHEFRIQVEGELSEVEVNVISGGIQMPSLGHFRPASVKIVEKLNGRTVMLMVTRGTKARLVRRMFSTLRHQITLLRRVRIGDIRLGTIPTGGVRRLDRHEVEAMRKKTAAERLQDPPGK